MNVVEFLKKVKELLADESNWIKESIAINHDYDNVEAYDEDACAWCLVGAIDCIAFYNEMPAKRVTRIDTFLNELIFGDDYSDIAHFNDHRDTKHADVMRFLDEAIEKAYSIENSAESHLHFQ